ncbi:hypothetical protein ABPG72_009790 [Tetrahymena utriculariae]
MIELNQYSGFQSLFSTKNFIAVSYQSNQGQYFIASYKNNNLQFTTQISQISTKVLANKQENQLILIGQNNLFTIWNLESQKIIYKPDFKQIYCDQRDSFIFVQQMKMMKQLQFQINTYLCIHCKNKNHQFLKAKIQDLTGLKVLLFKMTQFSVKLTLLQILIKEHLELII